MISSVFANAEHPAVLLTLAVMIIAILSLSVILMSSEKSTLDSSYYHP